MITVEDYNTVLLKYKNVGFWNTVKIDVGDYLLDYTDARFDYCTVTRTFNDNQYTFNISVDNELFGKLIGSNYRDCYIKSKENYTVTQPSKTKKEFHIVTTDSNISLDFYLSNIPHHNSISTNTPITPNWFITDVNYVFKNDTVKYTVDIVGTGLSNIYAVKNNELNPVTFQLQNNKAVFSLDFDEYEYIIFYGANINYSIKCLHFKNINYVSLPSNLVLNNDTVNSFELNSDSTNIHIESNYPVLLDGKSVTVNLNGKNNYKEVVLTVTTIEDDEFYPNSFKFRIPCNYIELKTEAQLKSFINTGGTVARLGANIKLTQSIILPNDFYIYGNNHTINCNGFNFIVEKTFKAQDLTFTNGNHSIYQKTNSKVELTDCTFRNCVATDNLLGACIFCDTELGNLAIDDDFTTNLYNCTFENNGSCIYHGGELIVDGCTVVDCGIKGYPQFLYQTDGACSVTGSNISFSIDSDEDIMYEACFVEIGETAIFNGASHDELSRNDSLPFFDRNNASVIDATYYYPSISAKVSLKSDNGVCHSVSGVDWIFKNNISLSREIE